ncbi:MAG: carbohydrate ABC transporter substrate-binding protein [Clostridiales bacterium]|nr:carbohydrate ABC transporter substrate-binding protein [Clostridiales bacterium]
MRKIKPFAIAMAVVMLIPVLTSCSSGKTGHAVVKEDDPWYNSTMFKLDLDTRQFETSAFVNVCTCSDKIFTMYLSSADMWASARTTLDTYDYDGNLVDRKEVSCPKDSSITDIYSVSADPADNTIKAAVYLNSGKTRGVRLVTIDTESAAVTDTELIISKEAQSVIKADSSVTNIIIIGDYTIAQLLHDYNGGPIYDWQLLLFKNNEFVTELDLSSLTLGEFLPGFSINESGNSLYAVAEGEDQENISMEFDLTTGKLKDKKSVSETDDKSVDFTEYSSTDKGDLCKIDSLGNIVKIDPDDMTPKTVIDTNWYTPIFCPVMDDDHYRLTGIVSCDENRTVLMESEATLYGHEDVTRTLYIRVLTKADKNPHAGKKVIDLALPPSFGVSDYLSKSIYEFNNSDDEYLIRVWDKYSSGFAMNRVFGPSEEDESKIYTMIQDLKGGDAPDLVIGIQKYYAMHDGIFMDLSGFLDPEVMDKQYGNIFEAGKIGGKQYFLPATLEIEGLVTNADLLKDGAAGITFDEFDKLIKENMGGFSPYDYPESKYYNKRSFILSCIDTKSAIEGEKIEFGTDQFRTAVEYAKENFIDYDDAKSTPWEYIHDYGRYRGECYYAKIDDYLDYVYSCYKSKGQYNIIGTPSVDASGPRFNALETISVSASTDVKDGCKKFLNYLFAGTAYASDECAFRQIVTNKEIMSKNIDTLTKLSNAEYEKFRNSVQSGAFIPAPGLDKATGDKEATEDMGRLFQQSLATISTYYYEDNEITKFVFEEISPYFAGDRSLDDAITFLNDRAAKYVKER